METVLIKRVSAGTIYKILTVGSLGGYFLLGIFIFFMTLFGLPLETASGESIGIVKSMAISLGVMLFGLITAPLFGGILWLTMWPALWLYSKFKLMKVSFILDE